MDIILIIKHISILITIYIVEQLIKCHDTILYYTRLCNTNTHTSNTGRARIHRASGIAGDAQHWMLRLV